MITQAQAEDRQTVTAVISHLVKPGQEAAYEQWLHDISAAVAVKLENNYKFNTDARFGANHRDVYMTGNCRAASEMPCVQRSYSAWYRPGTR